MKIFWSRKDLEKEIKKNYNLIEEKSDEKNKKLSKLHLQELVKKEEAKLKEKGFEYDEQNDIFVKEEFGAFVGPIDRDIHYMSDLYNSNYFKTSKVTKFNISLLASQGAEIISGPALFVEGPLGSISSIIMDGAYCKNYHEFLQLQSKKTGLKEKVINYYNKLKKKNNQDNDLSLNK